MAKTLEELKAQRDGLVAQLGGPSRVRFQDSREIQYRSIDEIQKAIVQIDAEIAALDGGRGSRTGFARHSRGFYGR